MKRRFTNLLIAAGAVAATLVFCELGVRYLQATIPPPPHSPYRADPDCGYVLNPGDPTAFPEDDDRHVNVLGFRDRDRAAPKPEGLYRVLGIGDSFVYGDVPIACNFLRILDDSLRVAPPAGRRAAEVMIGGLPGWDVRNAVGLMRGRGKSLKPNLAVLCFSLGSDVTGIPIPGAVFQGNLHFTGSRKPSLDLRRKSRLFILAEQLYEVRAVNWLRNLRARMHFGNTASAGPADTAAVQPESAAHAGAPEFPGMWGDPAASERRPPLAPHFLERRVENLPLYLSEPTPEITRLWREAERELLDFDAVCRAQGVDWILLIAPTEMQVDPVLRGQVLPHAPLPPAAYDFDLPTRELRGFAADHGIRYLDPLPALRAAQRDTGLRQYIPNNGHWSVPGNATVARDILHAMYPRS